MVGTDAIQTIKTKRSLYVPILPDMEEDGREDSYRPLQVLDRYMGVGAKSLPSFQNLMCNRKHKLCIALCISILIYCMLCITVGLHPPGSDHIMRVS